LKCPRLSAVSVRGYLVPRVSGGALVQRFSGQTATAKRFALVLGAGIDRGRMLERSLSWLKGPGSAMGNRVWATSGV